MRRPLALVGFACLFASAVSAFIGVWSGAAALFCLVCGGVLCCFRRFRKTPVVVLALFVCAAQFGLGFVSHQRYAGWGTLAETDAQITATVQEDAAESYGSFTAPVRITSLQRDGADVPVETDVTVRLSFGGYPAKAGEVVTGRVHFYLPAEGGGFSARTSAYAKGWPLYAYLYTYEPYTVTAGKTPFFIYLRRELTDALDTFLPEAEAELTKGVVFGVKDGMDDGVTAAFRSVGASHLLVVSGVHMSVVAGVLLRLLKRKEHKLGLPAALLVAGCTVCFMGITGWTPSVVRSGVMCLIGVLAALFHADYDSRTALGYAMAVLCVLHPLAGGGIGLCLSFLSVLGILQLEPWFTKWVNRLAFRAGRFARPVRWALLGASTSVSAVVFTLPVQVLFLGGISLLSPLISVILIPLATVLLPLGLLTALVGSIPFLAPAARLFALPCGWCAKLMAGTASFCSENLGWSYIPARAWMVPAVVGILFLVMCCIFIGAKRKARIACAAMSVVVLFTAWLGWQLTTGSAVRVAACGEESVLLFAQNKAYVLQLGEEDAIPVARALEENGAKKIELLCLSSDDEALRDAAARVLREFQAKTLVLPAGAWADEKLLLLTEAPVVPYDTSSELRLQYDDLILRLQNGWAAAFPGGTAVPTAHGVLVEASAGSLEISFEESLPGAHPLVLLGEDEIVYIDCLTNGQLQARRADGWPK